VTVGVRLAAETMGEDGQRVEAVKDGAASERPAPIPGPFVKTTSERMRPLLIISGALSAVLFIAMAVLDGTMKKNGGPGIVGLEVAGTAGRAAEILSQWGESGRDAARVSLLLDFPFLVSYAIFFGAACTAVGRGLSSVAGGSGARAEIAKPMTRIAPWLGWAFILAAVLDAIENVALLRVINFNLTPWTGVAQAAASPKLAIFGAGIVFLVFSLLLILSRRADAD
jgi:hypothetical protein